MRTNYLPRIVLAGAFAALTATATVVQPPSLSVPSVTIVAGEAFALPLDGNDPGGLPLTFSVISNGMSGLTTTLVPTNRTLRLDVSVGSTTNGTLMLELFEHLTPKTTARIINLVKSGFYNGLTFHRVIQDFMAQGGDPNGDGTGGSGVRFDDEFVAGLKFEGFGQLAMANSGFVTSSAPLGRDNNDSQFFITAPNLSVAGTPPPQHLNYRHTIFGQLTQGFDLFSQLMGASVDANGTPLDSIVINTASIITNRQAAVLYLIAPTNAAGPLPVTVQAQNSDGISTQVTFQITVVANTVNNPPFFDPMPSSIVITQGMSTSFPLGAWDDNSDSMTLNLFDGDTGTGVGSVTAQYNGGTGLLTLTPVANFFGRANLLFCVSDPYDHNGDGHSAYSSGSLDDVQELDSQRVLLNVVNTRIAVAANPATGGRVTGSGTAQATLTATAFSGWAFAGWSDGATNNPRTVVAAAGGSSYTANFGPATYVTLQANPANGGTVAGSGIQPQGFPVLIFAQPTMGWRFVNWSDGNTNRFRNIVLGAAGTNLTANFEVAPTSVLLQAGDGGMAGIWGLGTNYLPATWTTVTGAIGGGWVLRSMNQNRILLQQGTGGAINIWDLTNGVPSKTWNVSAALAGWIARDLDGNRVLLQAGDGGSVGIWTLNASNTPIAWSSISGPVAGFVTRALRGDRILLQAGTSTTLGYWTLNASNAITAWTPLTSTLPAGWIARAMTRDYMLLQQGDGGASGIWDLDGNGLPFAFHTLSAAMPGWIMRGIDQAIPAVITVGSSTNIGGSVTGGGTNYVGGSMVITATASNDWFFTGWNDGNTNATRSVVVPPGGGTYTATFVPAATLTVNANAGGTASGSGSYASGSSATISATASNGWLFTGWNDSVTNNPRTVTVPLGGATYTASFATGIVLGLQCSPTNSGTMTGAGTYLASTSVSIGAQALPGWKFLDWNDGDTNQTRLFTLGAVNTNLIANFTNSGALKILLQAGNGGMAGLWGLGTNYAPATWTSVTGPISGWVLRALDQNRILLQQGNGGAINIWDLTNGVPARVWNVSGALPGWIARDLDGNRVLLQAGDGGMVGMWTLNTNNVPVTWNSLAATVTPGLITRALSGTKVLVQVGTAGSYWNLSVSNTIASTTAISAAVPAGWVLRSMTPSYMLLQAGDGGMAGLWALDANGQPTAWYTVSGAMAGWVMRGLDQ